MEGSFAAKMDSFSIQQILQSAIPSLTVFLRGCIHGPSKQGDSMKLLCLIILFFTSQSFAASPFDGTYTVNKYTWCNGPSEGSTVGCWPYGWKQVNLGKLVEIKIESLQNVNYLTLRDSSGNTWYSNFTAKSSPESFDIKFGDINNSLEISIKDKELSLMVWSGAQSSYLVLDFSKN